MPDATHVCPSADTTGPVNPRIVNRAGILLVLGCLIPAGSACSADNPPPSRRLDVSADFRECDPSGSLSSSMILEAVNREPQPVVVTVKYRVVADKDSAPRSLVWSLAPGETRTQPIPRSPDILGFDCQVLNVAATHAPESEPATTPGSRRT